MKGYAYDRKKCNLEMEYKSKTNQFKGFNHVFTKIDWETATRLASRANYNKNNPNNPTEFLGSYDLVEEFIKKIIKVWRPNNFKYVVIPELQKRETWHFHLLTTNPFPAIVNNNHSCPLDEYGKSCQDHQFALNHMWPHGYTNVQRIKNSSQIPLAYLKKYLTKQIQLKSTNPELAKKHGLTKGISNYIFFRKCYSYQFLPEEQLLEKKLELTMVKFRLKELKASWKTLPPTNLEKSKTTLPFRQQIKKLSLEINTPQKIQSTKVQYQKPKSTTFILKNQPKIQPNHSYFQTTLDEHHQPNYKLSLNPLTLNFITKFQTFKKQNPTLSPTKLVQFYLLNNPFPISLQKQPLTSADDNYNTILLFYLAADLSDKQLLFDLNYQTPCRDLDCTWTNPNPNHTTKVTNSSPRAQFTFSKPQSKWIFEHFLLPYLELLKTSPNAKLVTTYEQFLPTIKTYNEWVEYHNVPVSLRHCPCYPATDIHDDSNTIITKKKHPEQTHCISKQLYNFHQKHVAATDIYPKKKTYFPNPTAEEASKRYADQDLIDYKETTPQPTSLKAFRAEWPDLIPFARNSYTDSQEHILNEIYSEELSEGLYLIDKHQTITREEYSSKSPEERHNYFLYLLEMESHTAFPLIIPYLRGLWSLRKLYNTNYNLYQELTKQEDYQYFASLESSTVTIETEHHQPKTNHTKEDIQEAIDNLTERLNTETQSPHPNYKYQDYLKNEINYFKNLQPNPIPQTEPQQPPTPWTIPWKEALYPSTVLTKLEELQKEYDSLLMQVQPYLYKKNPTEFEQQQLQELQDLKNKIYHA